MRVNIHPAGVFRRGVKSLLLVCAFASFSAAGVMPALSQVYIFDLLSTNPQLAKAWNRALPSDLKKVDWIREFGGPTNPLEAREINGKKYFLGWACKAHDCGGNEVSFLLAADGSAAFGAITSSELGIDMRFVGKPSSQIRQLLKTKFSN